VILASRAVFCRGDYIPITTAAAAAARKCSNTTLLLLLFVRLVDIDKVRTSERDKSPFRHVSLLSRCDLYIVPHSPSALVVRVDDKCFSVCKLRLVPN
jgi:hypothetical protein